MRAWSHDLWALLGGALVTGGLAGAAVWGAEGAWRPVLAAVVAALGVGAGALLAWRRGWGRQSSAATHAALEAARRGVVQARADVETLHRSVVHDLRSPIGAVLNFSAVLEDDHGKTLNPDARAILGRIRRSAESAIRLLDGLVRLARVGEEPLRIESVDVESVVRRLFAEFHVGHPALELTLGPLPAARADANLLQTAFGELLANAAKFSARREKPHIGVGGRRETDGTLVYWVVDDGVGFDVRFSHKLFGVFERLHSRDEFPGAGVGLAMVRRIAERHGGRVWAEAEPAGGARFLIALPGPERA